MAGVFRQLFSRQEQQDVEKVVDLRIEQESRVMTEEIENLRNEIKQYSMGILDCRGQIEEQKLWYENLIEKKEVAIKELLFQIEEQQQEYEKNREIDQIASHRIQEEIRHLLNEQEELKIEQEKTNQIIEGVKRSINGLAMKVAQYRESILDEVPKNDEQINMYSKQIINIEETIEQLVAMLGQQKQEHKQSMVDITDKVEKEYAHLKEELGKHREEYEEYIASISDKFESYEIECVQLKDEVGQQKEKYDQDIVNINDKLRVYETECARLKEELGQHKEEYNQAIVNLINKVGECEVRCSQLNSEVKEEQNQVIKQEYIVEEINQQLQSPTENELEISEKNTNILGADKAVAQDKKDLIMSILEYEWDDEDDINMEWTYEPIEAKEGELESKNEGIEADIYDQFRNYMLQNKIESNKSKEFLLHAQWMKDYEEVNTYTFVLFTSREPNYKQMNMNQMRYYFYWRSNLRKGIYKTADLGYILLYIYEILNNIGIKDYQEGHEKLIGLLREYGAIYRDVEGQLPQWIHDYLIIYGDSKTLFNVLKDIEEASHGSHFSARARFIRCLMSKEYNDLTNDLNKFSSYKVVREKFYATEENRVLYDKVLKEVVNRIDSYLVENKGISFAKKIMGESITDKWKVFNHALVDLESKEINCPKFIVNEEIRYWFDGEIWYTTYWGMRNDFDRVYITNLLKHIEQNLCNRLGIERKLKFASIPTHIESIVKEVVDKYCPEQKEEMVSLKILDNPLGLVKAKREEKYLGKTIYDLIEGLSYNQSTKLSSYMFYKHAVAMESQDSCSVTISRKDAYEDEVVRDQLEFVHGYFKWRKLIRKEVYQPTQLIYIYTYIYEILNRIGLKEKKEAIDILLKLESYYGSQYIELKGMISQWIIDYVIYYRCISEEKFFSVIDRIDQSTSVAESWNIIGILLGKKHEQPLYYLNKISSYDIFKSPYYNEQNERWINKVLISILNQINNLLLVNKQPGLYQLVIGECSKKEWIPFEGAVFYNKVKHQLLSTTETYLIHNQISYEMNRGFWMKNMPDIEKLQMNDYIGDLLRCIEYYVCKQHGMNLEVPSKTVSKYLETVVYNTVKDCYK